MFQGLSAWVYCVTVLLGQELLNRTLKVLSLDRYVEPQKFPYGTLSEGYIIEPLKGERAIKNFYG